MAEFEIRKTTDNGYYWRLQGDNNKTLCHSEVMTSKAAAQNGIAAVKAVASGAPTNDLT